MVTHNLYSLDVPEDSFQRIQPTSRTDQVQSGVLESLPETVRLAQGPSDRRISGGFVGLFGALMASEVEELLSASDIIKQVPYYFTGDSREWEGYYAPSQQESGDRQAPSLPGANQYGGSLSYVGSRQSHVRSVTVSPSSVTNPFGSATTEELYLAKDATDVRWIHQPTGAIETASVQTTVTGQHRDFNKYDVTEPAFDTEETYQLVYDIPYRFESLSDPVVWDTYNNEFEELGTYVGDTVGSGTQVGTATVGTQSVVSPAWQRVYSSSHDYVGELVITNGRLKLEPRPSSGVLRAYQWNDTEGVYEVVQLGVSDWRLDSFEVTNRRGIGLERVKFLSRWRNTSTNATYELVGEVRRGFDVVQWYQTENASTSTPAGLVTRLSPVAYGSDQHVGEAQGVVERDSLPDE